MSKRGSVLALASFLLVLLLSVAPSQAEDRCCGWSSGCGSGDAREVEIDLTQGFNTPEVLRGPALLKLTNANTLRYETKVGRKLTVEAGPDVLLTGFVFNIPDAKKAPGGDLEVLRDERGAVVAVAEAIPSPDRTKAEEAARQLAVDRTQELATYASGLKVRGAVSAIEARGKELGVPPEVRVRIARAFLQDALEKLSNNVVTAMTQAKSASGAVAAVAKRVETLVRESDNLLRTGGDLSTEVATVHASVESARMKGWPSGLGDLRGRMDDILSEFREMPLRMEGFSMWTANGNNRDDYRQSVETAEELSTDLKSIENGNDNRKAFDRLQAALGDWSVVLSGLKDPKAYEIAVPVACGHPHFSTRTTEIEIVRIDRLESDPKKNTSKEILARVVCPSSLSVSSGVGISGIDEREYAIVQGPGDMGGDGLARVIAFESRSSEQVNPTLLMNTRLSDCPNFDFHLSAGSVFDFDSSDDGVAIGYLLGASVSFRDGFFLTVGAQTQRVETLTGGFALGDVVPEDLTEPPVEKEWQVDWVAVATFKIR